LIDRKRSVDDLFALFLKNFVFISKTMHFFEKNVRTKVVVFEVVLSLILNARCDPDPASEGKIKLGFS